MRDLAGNESPFRMPDSYYDPPEQAAHCPACCAGQAKLDLAQVIEDHLAGSVLSAKTIEQLLKEDAEFLLDAYHDQVYSAVSNEDGRLCADCNTPDEDARRD